MCRSIGASLAWAAAGLATLLLYSGLEKAMVSVANWRRGRGMEISGRVQAVTQRGLSLECIVALGDRNEAEEIARKKLVGADTITAVELSRAQLAALNIKQGDIVFEPGPPGLKRGGRNSG